MPVTIHLRNGQINEHRHAATCAWKSTGSSANIRNDQPRFLICTNEKGEVVASYKESEVNGFRKEKVQGFRFPTIRKLRA